MCTVFILRNRLGDFGTVLAGNRDEMLDRPWTGPRAQAGRPAVLMPTDDRAGGTWVGVNDAGLAVAITNRMSQPSGSGQRSRGLLCRDVAGAGSLAQGVRAVRSHLRAQPYDPFNLILADGRDAVVLRYGNDGLAEEVLGDGIHVVSSRGDLNPGDLLGARMIVDMAASASQGDPEVLANELLPLLGDHNVLAPQHPICKHNHLYGTLCTAIAAVSSRLQPVFLFGAAAPCRTPLSPVDFGGLRRSA